MRFESCFMYLSFVLTHALGDLVLELSLLYLGVKHPWVIALSLSLIFLEISNPFLLCVGIHSCLLEHHLLYFLLCFLSLIVHVNLLVETLMNQSPALRSFLNLINVPCLLLLFPLSLVHMLINIVEPLFLGPWISSIHIASSLLFQIVVQLLHPWNCPLWSLVNNVMVSVLISIKL